MRHRIIRRYGMKSSKLNQTVAALVTSAALLAGMSLPARAQQPALEPTQQENQNKQKEEKQQRKAQNQQQQQQQQQDKQKQKAQKQHNAKQQRQQHQQQDRQQLVQQQQQRVTQYRQHLDEQYRTGREQTAQLQQQKRMQQYRFQQQYLARLHQQQLSLGRRHDYDRDLYFSTPYSYRYNRGGNYYETNEYGARLLRQAVNNGYEQGFRAGRADRLDHWGSSFEDSYGYRDANYGYSGYYVQRDDYNYYFREGFRRGYEDAYNSRYQYGHVSGGKYLVLGAVLGTIP